jgi:hypothetical protein
MEDQTSKPRASRIFTPEIQKKVSLFTFIIIVAVTSSRKNEPLHSILFAVLLLTIIFQIIAMIKNYDGRFTARHKFFVFCMALTIAIAIWQFTR